MVVYLLLGVVVLLFLICKGISGYCHSPEAQGEAGEATVSEILHQALDEHHYRIYNNIMLKTNRGITTQIDHVVVSQYGVFVIETKNISGWVFASERGRQWTQTLPAWDGWGSAEKFHFQNPLRQNYLHIATLAYQLRIPKHHIIGLVAFPDETDFKKGYPVGVYTYSSLPSAILSRRDKVFDVKTTRAIAQAIATANAQVTDEERANHVSNLKIVHGQFD